MGDSTLERIRNQNINELKVRKKKVEIWRKFIISVIHVVYRSNSREKTNKPHTLTTKIYEI